jgi:hypothetical protein
MKTSDKTPFSAFQLSAFQLFKNMNISKLKFWFMAIALLLLAIFHPLSAILLAVTASAVLSLVTWLRGKGCSTGVAVGALGAATLNYQLTAYAQGLWNDIQDVIKLAERLAPTTPVPGASGQFKKFDDKNSFMPEKTMRQLGGDPVIIAFNATDDAYNCRPQALEVRVDKEEDQAAGHEGGEVLQNLLDQGKIKALVNKVALSHVLDVTTTVLGAVAPGWSGAPSGLGQWSNPDIDPIDQINTALLALSQNCGSTQNVKITMDIMAWNALRLNPKAKARALFGAASSLASISTDQLNASLIFPCDIMVANIVYDTTRLEQNPNKQRVMQSTCLLHYSVPNATIYDPSAFKTFTVGAAGFLGNVRTYIAPNQLWRGHLVDWSRDIHQTSLLSMVRINQS